MTTYNGTNVNNLANFKNAATLGFDMSGTKAGQLGAALASAIDAASRSMCRLIESESHAETPFVSQCYRQACVDQRLLISECAR